MNLKKLDACKHIFDLTASKFTGRNPSGELGEEVVQKHYQAEIAPSNQKGYDLTETFRGILKPNIEVSSVHPSASLKMSKNTLFGLWRVPIVLNILVAATS